MTAVNRKRAAAEAQQREIARLRDQVSYLQAAARELVGQRDALGERAANLAGELAVLKAQRGDETTSQEEGDDR